MELVATSPIIVLIVLVVVVVLEPTLVMVTSVANLVVPFHFVARLLHVVVAAGPSAGFDGTAVEDD